MTWKRSAFPGFISYLDGELIEQMSATDEALPLISANVLIGSDDQGDGTKGALAEVRIWRVARSQAEIQATMRQRLSGKEANLIACFPLNEIKVEGNIRVVNDLVSNRWCKINGEVVLEEMISAGAGSGAAAATIDFGNSTGGTRKIFFRALLASRLWDANTNQLQAAPVKSQIDFSVHEFSVNDTSARDVVLTGLQPFRRGNHTITVQWKKTEGGMARISDGASVRSMMLFQL